MIDVLEYLGLGIGSGGGIAIIVILFFKYKWFNKKKAPQEIILTIKFDNTKETIG